MVDSNWTSLGGGFHVHIPIKRPKAENHIIFLHFACFRYQIASVLGQIFVNINHCFLGLQRRNSGKYHELLCPLA